VEFLFAFTLAAGLVVLFAAVTATREERAREFAIMRAMGARASLLRQVQRAELVGVGLLAGFLASAWPWAWAGRWRAMCSTLPGRPLWVPLAGALAGAVLALAGRVVGPARSAAPPRGRDAAPRRRIKCYEKQSCWRLSIKR
jgi:putative ABC transport system permease protein